MTPRLPTYPNGWILRNPNPGPQGDKSVGAHALYRAEYWALKAEDRSGLDESARYAVLAQAWAAIAVAHKTGSADTSQPPESETP